MTPGFFRPKASQPAKPAEQKPRGKGGFFRPPTSTPAAGAPKCADCGKEFEVRSRQGAVTNCCDTCQTRRLQTVDAGILRERHLVELPLPENKRWFRTRTFWILAVAVAGFATVAFFSVPAVKRRYHQWNERRYVGRAQEFYAKGDFKHAVLDARSALISNPVNVEATRLIAQSLEAMGAPQALQWRRRLASIVPGDAENALAWAADALKTGDATTAGHALAGLKPEDRTSARYHDLAATLALGRRETEAAESHWAEAAKLDPKEDRYRLELATVRMNSTVPAMRAGALEVLRELSGKPATRLVSLRPMLDDALGRGDLTLAKGLADELASTPGATMVDKLRRLSTLRALRDPEATGWLPQLKDEAMSKPRDLDELLSWMNRNSLTLLVLEWLPDLPADTAAQPPVCVAIAEAYGRSLEWKKLAAATSAGSWGEQDYVRGAYRTRALEQLGDRDGAANAWRDALAAVKTVEQAEALAKAALEWRWETRAGEALWKLSTSDRCPRWALDFLWTAAEKAGDTQRLLTLSRRIMTGNPRSIAARNDFVCLSLLTRTMEADTHALAAALYQEAPGDVDVTSTYGLSLFQQGRVAEAVAVMRTLKPEQLQKPTIAFYHGLFLLASGHAAEAKPHLELGVERPLLAEEKALLDRVTAASRSEAVPPPEAAPATASKTSRDSSLTAEPSTPAGSPKR